MKRFLGVNIGNCPHTEGLYKAARVANKAGFETFVCKPNLSEKEILQEIYKFNPHYVGFTYRLSPQKGFNELKKILTKIEAQGLLRDAFGQLRKFAFAGLPDTIKKINAQPQLFPVDIFPVEQVTSPMEQVEIVFDFFDLPMDVRQTIMEDLKEELFPPKIEVLDELADAVVENENYRAIGPLPIPSEGAKKDYILRMSESPYPLLRSHFGIPDESIMPTVEGIRDLANLRVIDEVSIGSSDLSQRYYNKPEEFRERKNDGGVPYKDIHDLRELFLASRTGNFPSCKPYAHVTGLLDFIDDCISTGHLIGAHQAIPLYYFNQLDGRGYTPVRESLKEHVAAIRKLAELGIPTEMNDPNQWSSRWAHDTIIVASYGLISSVMLENYSKKIILQMQFNKPVETSDFGDLAKMRAGEMIAKKMRKISGFNATFFNETRTGIESFSTDLDHAKWQLARSTLLQMFLNPKVIHLVSYCEAVRAATVEDITESSQIIRRAVDLFRKNEYDLIKYEQEDLVIERRTYLIKQAQYLLNAIGKLDPDFSSDKRLTTFLANPDTLYEAIKKGYMAAPGIMNPEFKNEQLVTKPIKNGFFEVVDFKTGTKVLTEKERLTSL